MMARIGDTEKKIGDVGVVDKMLNKLADYFNEGGAHLQDWLACRTSLEGLAFAKKLLEEALQQLVALKAEVGRLQARLLDAGKSFSEETAARLKQEKVDYKRKLFNEEAVKSLNQALVVSQDIQREQSQAVRTAIVGQLGEQRQGFATINERIDASGLKAIFESVCESEVEKAHENMVTANTRVLRVNVVSKVHEEYGASEEKLGAFVRETINKAGVFIKFNQTQVALAGPGTVPERVGRVIRTEGVFLPACKEAADFRDRLGRLFEANKKASAFAVIQEGARANEIAVIGVTNLFTARCVDPLSGLKDRYETRRAQSEEARTLLHGEGDGSQFPTLFVPPLQEIKASKLPYVLLAKAAGMLKEQPDRNTGKPMTVFTCEEDGLPADFVLGNGNLLNAIEDMNATTLAKIEAELGPRIKKALHEERQQWLEGVRSTVRWVYEQRGQNASDEVYLRFKDCMGSGVKRLLELA